MTPKEDTCYTNKSLKRFVSRSEEVEHRLLPPFNAAWYDTLQIIHTYLQVNRTKFWFWWSGGKIYKEEALYLNVRSLGNLSCVKLSSLPSKRFFSLKRIFKKMLINFVAFKLIFYPFEYCFQDLCRLSYKFWLLKLILMKE